MYEYMMKNGCRIGGEPSGHLIFSEPQHRGWHSHQPEGVIMMARKRKAQQQKRASPFIPRFSPM